MSRDVMVADLQPDVVEPTTTALVYGPIEYAGGSSDHGEANVISRLAALEAKDVELMETDGLLQDQIASNDTDIAALQDEVLVWRPKSMRYSR